MNNQCFNKQRTHESSEYIPAASHYALKLAFQALKERFEKIQNRLTVIEMENAVLKGKSGKEKCDCCHSSKVDELHKKIDDLSRQKSQLSHHIFILANENKRHWDRMSRMTEEKDKLLDEIKGLNLKLELVERRETNQEYPSFILKDTETNLAGSPKNCNFDEPVSEEDEQDFLSSIETVKDLTIENGANRIDLKGFSDELKDTIKELEEDRTLLRKQQAGLSKALESMREIFQGMKLYSLHLQHIKTDSELPNEEVLEQEKQLEGLLQTSEVSTIHFELGDAENSYDQICPFCSKVFVKDTVAKEYHEHFMNHVDTCSENESALNSFEIID